MPRRDGSGPQGMGPMTGRGAGYCASSHSPEYMSVGTTGRFGLGLRRGFRGSRFGRGFQSAYVQPVYSKDLEQRELEHEVTFLKDQLKSLEERLSSIKKEN